MHFLLRYPMKLELSKHGEMSQSNSTTETPQLQRGILYMTLGTSIVPVMDAVAKYLGDSMSPIQITWGRFFFQALIMLVGLVITLGPRSLVPKKPLIHAIRGVLLATATLFFFTSLRYLPLADAIAIFFVQPMILTLISAFVLHEHVGWHRRVAVLTGFAGALLIIRPGTDAFLVASLLPLGAAVFFASYLALTRAVANIDHPATMQFSSGVSAVIVLSIALLVANQWPGATMAPKVPTLSEWFWLAMIGVIAAGGHLLVVMAMNRAPASALAPFGYIEIVAATALGWLFFNDWPDKWTWIGIAIIVASGAYVYYREQKLNPHTPA